MAFIECERATSAVSMSISKESAGSALPFRAISRQEMFLVPKLSKHQDVIFDFHKAYLCQEL
ncbi:hypothetical protein SAMN05216316_1656 [Nitrosovibrio sp. Nv6]|nr:hypothetical protein SAMN05216316_1656 [Nitrosovibrio sp. Nv6]